ncbi:MAG: hypothetical protein RR636_06495 [Clostridium sp.]|uniref:hypothetical protein n=1 Tax=Clostridium sp. TaxID=1506 RepID=UPI00304DEA6A
MSVYQITYYEAEVHEDHECGCGHDHEHDNNCNHDHEHHHHHSNLPRKIKSLGTWANIMPTTFLLNTEMSSNDIKVALDEVKASNETFFISEITSNNAGSMHPSALAWIETRLK